MIYFSIPGYTGSNKKLNLFLLEYKQHYPDRFYDDIIIESCYDCFHSCIWGGGRACSGYTTLDEMLTTIHDFNRYNISLRHVFTNAFLEEKHLYDTFGNKILELSAKTIIPTGITINSELLYNYIQTTFPEQFYFTWSATKGMSDISILNQLSQKDNVVPSYQDFNRAFSLYPQLQNPQNIELIVNEACEDDCPYKIKHYQSFNQWQLWETVKHMECVYSNREPNYYSLRTGHKHNISYEEIHSLYLPYGINHFKISGRETFPLDLIETYMNYFIKPEVRDRVRFDFLYYMYEQQ